MVQPGYSIPVFIQSMLDIVHAAFDIGVYRGIARIDAQVLGKQSLGLFKLLPVV